MRRTSSTLIPLAGAVVFVAICWRTLAATDQDPRVVDLALANENLACELAGTPSVELAASAARRTGEPFVPLQADEAIEGRLARAGSERALRDAYLALERSNPGILASRAEEWIGGTRPSIEKVAWLSAMQKNDAASALPWLEFACGASDPAGVHGESPAAYALGQLVQLAPRDASAVAALERVATARETVDLALRRRAATSCAAFAGPELLQAFSAKLRLEPDEALRAGVVVALEERKPTGAGIELERLLAWLRPASAEYLARDASGTP